MFKFDGDILRKLAPLEAKEWADAFNLVSPMYDINSADIFHEFLANVLHESDNLKRLAEGLNYSVESLLKKFGRHRISVEDAERFGRKKGQRANQVMLANILYGGPWGLENLGNTKPSDGWELRGAGPIQITGRRNFTLFWIWMNKFHGFNGTLKQLAELIRTDKVIAVHSACWVFAIAKKLIDEAIDDKMDKIVKRINGGFFGMTDRMEKLQLCKMHIVDLA